MGLITNLVQTASEAQVLVRLLELKRLDVILSDTVNASFIEL